MKSAEVIYQTPIVGDEGIYSTHELPGNFLTGVIFFRQKSFLDKNGEVPKPGEEGYEFPIKSKESSWNQKDEEYYEEVFPVPPKVEIEVRTAELSFGPAGSYAHTDKKS